LILYITQTELYLILCQNSSIFVAIATEVDQGLISGTPLNWATWKTPSIVQHSRLYRLSKSSCS